MSTLQFALAISVCLAILAALAYLLDYLPPEDEAQPVEEAPQCEACGLPLTWEECWMCDPGDDDCFVCGKERGWWECWNCWPDLAEDKEPEHERTSAGIDR